MNQTARIAPIRDEAHYDKMVQLADALIDLIGDAKQHPLLDLLELISGLIQDYDAAHYAVPDASPKQVLAFLMEKHGLTQSNLPEVSNQSVISMLLSGTRQINALSKRFGVQPGVFLEQATTLH